MLEKSLHILPMVVYNKMGCSIMLKVIKSNIVLSQREKFNIGTGHLVYECCVISINAPKELKKWAKHPYF